MPARRWPMPAGSWSGRVGPWRRTHSAPSSSCWRSGWSPGEFAASSQPAPPSCPRPGPAPVASDAAADPSPTPARGGNEERIWGRGRCGAGPTVRGGDLVRRPSSVLCGLELQGQRVDAVAQAGRGRAVGEHMAEVAAAPCAGDLGAAHAERLVLVLLDRPLRQGLVKLGHPDPESNLVEVGNSSAPHRRR